MYIIKKTHQQLEKNFYLFIYFCKKNYVPSHIKQNPPKRKFTKLVRNPNLSLTNYHKLKTSSNLLSSFQPIYQTPYKFNNPDSRLTVSQLLFIHLLISLPNPKFQSLQLSSSSSTLSSTSLLQPQKWAGGGLELLALPRQEPWRE